MKKRSSSVTRRSFIGSLPAASGMLATTASAQNKRPEFTGPLVKEKLPGDVTVTRSNDLNLIVLICDTFRWDHLHFNGNDRIITPNLDRLAEESVYFENCFTDVLPTIPARRVLHTGKSYLNEKVGWWRQMDPTDVTLAEVLGKAGFTTGFIVDTFHHFKPNMNFHRGFDSWRWIRGQESDPYVSGPRDSVIPENHTPPHLLNDYFRERIIQYVLNTKDRTGEDDYFCAQSLSAGAQWLEENKDNDGPFMMFVDMFDPHEPWDAPPRFQQMYRKKYPYDRYIFGYGVNMEDIRPDDIPIIRDLYAAEVSFTDYCIGWFLNQVKQLGLMDNTIIAFSTDHGTHLGEDGCVQKQAKNLKSCLAKIPWLIRHPDASTRGKRITGFTSHVDFMPTFLGLLGVEGHTGMHGMNAWDLVTGAKSSLRDYTVSGYGNFAAVHDDRWHYLQNFKGKDPGYGPALFDIRKDPLETVNVIDDHPGVVAAMKKRIEEACDVKL